MHNLEGLTFLFHVRIDTEERARNLKIITDYYRKNFTNFKNIFIEDDNKMSVSDIIELTENDTYVFSKSTDEWNKCLSFNKGIALAKSEILAFHDLDAIIPPEQMLEAIRQLTDDKEAGLVYPYNGIFLCVNDEIKNTFANSLDYKDLTCNWPERLQVNYSNGRVLVGSLGSVGGCVLGRRDNVISSNGYNPNFKGWGYEDNEFPRRVHIMGFSVSKLTDTKAALWHLPHNGPGSSKKADNPYYNKNHEIVTFVETRPKEEVREYTKTSWSVI
jgi:predicted glycosyltransferase involved in capsule biosynthesis